MPLALRRIDGPKANNRQRVTTPDRPYTLDTNHGRDGQRGNLMTRKRKTGHANLEQVDVPFGPNVRNQLVSVFVEAGDLHNKNRKQKAGNRTGNGRLYKGSNSPSRTTYKGTDRMDIESKAAPQSHFEGYSRLIESRPGFTGPQRQPIPEPTKVPKRKAKVPKAERKRKIKRRKAQNVPVIHRGVNHHNTSPARLRALGLSHLIQ